MLKMDIKLCRTCGKSGQDFIHIFRMEGLKNKIETCLPIVVSQHCLLPDTLCPDCLTSIESFYTFTKSSLQNIIILENQLDIQDSCLKSKRRQDKSCSVSLPLANESKSAQTEDYLSVLLGNAKEPTFPLTNKFLNKRHFSQGLVDYEVASDSNLSDNNEDCGQVILGEKLEGLKIVNNLVSALLAPTKRPAAQKRKSESSDGASPKICKRKCRIPKKLNKNAEKHLVKIKKEIDDHQFEDGCKREAEEEGQEEDSSSENLPQCCLLCNIQLDTSSLLAEHFLNVHTKDAVQSTLESSNCDSGETCNEKRKRTVPNLLKISDLRRSDESEEFPNNHPEDEAAQPPKITCPSCSTIFATKMELFVHLQLNHSELSMYLCGICLEQTDSAAKLRAHVLNCVKIRPLSNRYFCQICCFDDNNYRRMESHVLVHNFLWKTCQKEVRNFDPEDYIQQNPNFGQNNCASPVKNFSCPECNRSDFDTFRKFSIHRRNVHSIFHCDLCNKFYGRNSHLWKHVNRLHKNHPSITCQICFKTSASKYHLAQHFSKIHQAKVVIKKEEEQFEKTISEEENTKSFINNQGSTDQDTSNDDQSDNDNSMDDDIVAPKEIDPSHDMYVDIVTNNSPIKTDGDHKCPKCFKKFHKQSLLKKHNKNCRPKLQKDLLTRCKTCSRIFKDRQSLAKHLINYHSEYECEICNEKVASKCGIVSHIRFQHPCSHLECSLCFNILRCREDYLQHLADHDNSFVCQFCGDDLASKVKLKMHILSLHRKILSLSCGICLKLFESQQILCNHVNRVHKDQLIPLTSCPVCGKNYGSKWKTYDHVTKSHGQFFKACKVCLELYQTETELQNHLKSAHPNYQFLPKMSSKPNPIAILQSSIKNDQPDVNSNHNVDSENEENTEETDNNSQTSDTEDEDNSNQPVLEEQQKPFIQFEENASSAFCSQENKMSLLEKRLVGQENISSNKYKLGLVNNALTIIKSTAEELPAKGKTKRDDDINFHNKKSDSHKRTVYENSNDPSRCEICKKTWPAKKHLWQHYIRCHKNIAATVCGICLKTNESYESLQIHLKQNHPNLLYGQGFGSNYICKICGRYHNASSKLRLHMVIHEKFEWSLLDKFPPLTKYPIKANGAQQTEYAKVEKGVNILKGNTYEDLIEQVEESCSSTDLETGCKSQETSCDSNTDGRDVENQLSFSNLLQTLKNHGQLQALDEIRRIRNTEAIKNVLDANVRAQSVIHLRQGNNISSIGTVDELKKIESEECSSGISECEPGPDDLKGTLEYGRNMFRPKPEELDSAIKSISDSTQERQINNQHADSNNDVVQLDDCLNETEIESAVGSIL